MKFWLFLFSWVCLKHRAQLPTPWNDELSLDFQPSADSPELLSSSDSEESFAPKFTADTRFSLWYLPLAWAALASLRRKAVRRGSRRVTPANCANSFRLASLRRSNVTFKGFSPGLSRRIWHNLLWYRSLLFRAAVRKYVDSGHNLTTNPAFQADTIRLSVIGRAIRRQVQIHSSSCVRKEGFCHPFQRIDGRGSGKICYPMPLKPKGRHHSALSHDARQKKCSRALLKRFSHCSDKFHIKNSWAKMCTATSDPAMELFHPSRGKGLSKSFLCAVLTQRDESCNKPATDSFLCAFKKNFSAQNKTSD